MIICKAAELPRYAGMDGNLDEAIQFLLNHDPGTLSMGRHEIKGGDIYANRLSFVTVPPEETFFESHRLYTDMHVILSGKERVFCAQESSLQKSDIQGGDDFTALRGEASSMVDLGAGDVLIVFPGEAHQVKVMAGEPAQVEKLVVKVRVHTK